MEVGWLGNRDSKPEDIRFRHNLLSFLEQFNHNLYFEGFKQVPRKERNVAITFVINFYDCK